MLHTVTINLQFFLSLPKNNYLGRMFCFGYLPASMPKSQGGIGELNKDLRWVTSITITWDLEKRSI